MATIVFPPAEVLLRDSPTPPHQATSNEDRESSQAKKKTVPAPNKARAPNRTRASSNAGQNAVEKPKMSKSRTGCVTCKLKRLKCDETKPTCQQCERRKVECGGYKRDFKWRSFDETTAKTVPSNPRKKKQVNSTMESSASQFRIDLSCPPPRASVAQKVIKSTEIPQAAPSAGKSPVSTDGFATTESHQSSVVVSPEQEHGQDISASQTLPGHAASVPDVSSNPQAHSASTPNVDPALLMASDDPLLGLDVDDVDNILRTCDPEILEGMPLDLDPDFGVEEIPRPDFGEHQLPNEAIPQALVNSLALVPGDFRSAPYKTVPRNVDYSPDGVEAIAMRFDRVTCAILSIKNGSSENPWRTLVWDMAQGSPSLFHAVCAMTSFHSARKEPQFTIKGHEHMQLCFQNLSEGLREDSVTLENAIATSITLAFAHCWNELTSSGNVYIKGARSIIGKALTEHRKRPRQGIELARLKFLCNAWVYLDVIVRLTCTDEDETDDYEEIFSAFSNPGVDHEGFGIDFGLPIDARLDPLMGCANTLFPLIGRTANLARRVRRSATTSLAIIDQARELKDLIEAWRPPMYILPPEDPSSTVEHSVQTAEAYRWATLLYLHQTVPEIPMATSSQLAAKVLVLLATVPLSSRFVIVHIFPLMAAGCETVSVEDREWVRHRWAGLARRLDIGTIDKCIELTEEVWRRRDEVSPAPRHSLVSTAAMQRRASYDLNPPPVGWQFDAGFPTPDAVGSNMPMQLEPAWPQVAEWDGNAGLDREYHLGGRLHWLGVMKEWGWDVLLG